MIHRSMSPDLIKNDSCDFFCYFLREHDCVRSAKKQKNTKKVHGIEICGIEKCGIDNRGEKPCLSTGLFPALNIHILYIIEIACRGKREEETF